MRKIYTLLCALIASTAIWAQNPDPSAWSVGDNVIKDLGMGDVDPTETWTMKNRYYNGNSDHGDYGEYWQGVGQKFFFDYIDPTHDVDANSNGSHILSGHESEAQTAVGFYGDGHVTDDDPDLYQVVYMPPGAYTIRVQACYRDCSGGGNAVVDAVKAYVGKKLDANGKQMKEPGIDPPRNWEGIIKNGKYNTDGMMIGGYRSFLGSYVKNAQIYADILTDDDPESEVTREYYKNVKHMGDTDATKQLCGWSGDWRDDKSLSILTDQYDEDDEEWLKKKFYFPCSIMGASVHFKQGNYWNELKILVEEPSYVRLGIRKVGYVTEDWMAFSEWQVIYEGEATEEVQMAFATQEFDHYIEQLEQLEEKFGAAVFAGFNTSFNQAIAGEIGDKTQLAKNEQEEEVTTLQEMIALNQRLQKEIDVYDDTYDFLNNLSYLFVRCAALINEGSLPGLSAFQTAYNNILAKVNGCEVENFETKTPLDFSTECFNDLADARGAYLDTQVADENGAKDFSAVINQPWFVNDGVKIAQSEEGNYTTSYINEPSWMNEEGTSSLQNDDTYYNGENLRWSDRSDIASTVSLVTNSTEVKNKWYVVNFCEGARSEGYALRYYNGLMGPGDTYHSGNLSAGYMGVLQNIVGLPKGYYSLKALVRSWGGGYTESSTDNYNNIFMQNSKGEEVAAPIGSSESSWQDQTTGIINVDDRQLVIGFKSGYTAQITGFRLLFYGTEPPVENLLKQEIAEIEEMKNDLIFAGDVKAVDALIAQCEEPFTIDNFDVYRGYLNDARIYIRAAKSAYNNNKAADTYTSLQAEYGSEGQAYDILDKAWEVAFAMGDAETDTYKDIAPANELADKYGDYMKVYKEAVGYNDPDLNGILATQESALTAGIQTKEVLDSYMKQLNLPINVNKMKALGAGAATETSPVDVTAMLFNPTFELDVLDDGSIEPNDVWERGHGDGWNPEGSGNAQSNEYSRGNYEVWNSGASGFTFSQTLTGMPAGTYELSCLAVYREQNAVNADAVAAFEAAGNEEDWPSHYAQLFAKGAGDNDNFTYIKAVERLKGTDFSFSDVPTAYEIDEDTNKPYATAVTVLGLDEDVATYDYGEMKWTHIAQNAAGEWTKATKNDETGEWTYSEESGDKGTYPFDTEVEIDGVKYYFPASMYGFWVWSQKDPERVFNKVRFTIESGENIQLGIRKEGGASGDWVIFDDFQLKYLSGSVLNEIDVTEIQDVDAEKNVQNDVRVNVAGQVVDKSYKGIVILSNGKKVIQ